MRQCSRQLIQLLSICVFCVHLPAFALKSFFQSCGQILTEVLSRQTLLPRRDDGLLLLAQTAHHLLAQVQVLADEFGWG